MCSSDLLTAEHRDLNARFESRVVQVTAIGRSVEGLYKDQAELNETFQALRDLHWDHVALARRLAAIEDILARADVSAEEPSEAPSLPFPGL